MLAAIALLALLVEVALNAAVAAVLEVPLDVGARVPSHRARTAQISRQTHSDATGSGLGVTGPEHADVSRRTGVTTRTTVALVLCNVGADPVAVNVVSITPRGRANALGRLKPRAVGAHLIATAGVRARAAGRWLHQTDALIDAISIGVTVGRHPCVTETGEISALLARAAGSAPSAMLWVVRHIRELDAGLSRPNRSLTTQAGVVAGSAAVIGAGAGFTGATYAQLVGSTLDVAAPAVEGVASDVSADAPAGGVVGVTPNRRAPALEVLARFVGAANDATAATVVGVGLKLPLVDASPAPEAVITAEQPGCIAAHATSARRGCADAIEASVASGAGNSTSATVVLVGLEGPRVHATASAVTTERILVTPAPRIAERLLNRTRSVKAFFSSPTARGAVPARVLVDLDVGAHAATLGIFGTGRTRAGKVP